MSSVFFSPQNSFCLCNPPFSLRQIAVSSQRWLCTLGWSPIRLQRPALPKKSFLVHSQSQPCFPLKFLSRRRSLDRQFSSLLVLIPIPPPLVPPPSSRRKTPINIPPPSLNPPTCHLNNNLRYRIVPFSRDALYPKFLRSPYPPLPSNIRLVTPSIMQTYRTRAPLQVPRVRPLFTDQNARSQSSHHPLTRPR